MKKLLLSSLFVIVLLLGVVPVSASATDAVPPHPLPKSCVSGTALPFLDPEALPFSTVRYRDEDDGGAWFFEGEVTALCTLDYRRFQLHLAEVSYRDKTPFDDRNAVYSTWVTTGASFPPVDAVSMMRPQYATISLHDRVLVSISGRHVSPDGVNWDLCVDGDCAFRHFLDTLFGFSSTQLIIEGAYPSHTCPEYGFIPWSITPLKPDWCWSQVCAQ